MDVVCSGAYEALDGQPTVDPRKKTCGRSFAVEIERGDPADPTKWSVKTDEHGNVVSRHASVLCPDCGAATFVVEEGDA